MGSSRPALKTAALILAAGRGTRAQAPVPKAYAGLPGGAPVARAVAAMLQAPAIDLVQVVIAAGDAELYAAAIGAGDARLLPPVLGGSTRQQSALKGLIALEPHAPARVLIHDSARPFLTSDVIDRVLAALA